MRPSLKTLLLIAFVVLAAPVAEGASQPTIDEIFALARVGDLSISPDGSQVAYGFIGEIRVVESDGSNNRALAPGGAPQWSPSGRQVAFLSDAGGSRQIWTADAAGGNARPLTAHDGFIDRFRWGPDGSRIAFLARPADQARLNYFVRRRSPGEPTVVDHNNLPRNRLWVVDLKTKSSRPITPDEFSVGGYEQWFPDGFSWSPDGKQIAFSRRPHAKAGSHLDADIAVVEVDTGRFRILAERQGMDGYPQWSPSGDAIAFITTERRDWVTVSHIYRIQVNGGGIEKLTPGFDEKIKEFFWADAGRRILFIAGRGVSTQLFSLDVAAKKVKALTDGDLVRSGLAVSRDGSSLAYAEQGPDAPPEVYAASLEPFRPKRLTRSNPRVETGPRSRPRRSVGRVLTAWESRGSCTSRSDSNQAAGTHCWFCRTAGRTA